MSFGERSVRSKNKLLEELSRSSNIYGDKGVVDFSYSDPASGQSAEGTWAAGREVGGKGATKAGR